MAKKDFKGIVKEKELNNVGAITKSMFSPQTLKKAEEKQEEIKVEEKKKRKYTRLATREEKTRAISLRLTEKDYNLLIAKAEKSQSETITNYIVQLIRGAK